MPSLKYDNLRCSRVRAAAVWSGNDPELFRSGTGTGAGEWRPWVFAAQGSIIVFRAVQVERTFRLSDGSNWNAVGVDHGGLQACVPKQGLDGTGIVIRLQQVGGKGVPAGVRRNALGDLGAANRMVEGILQFAGVKVVAPAFAAFLQQRQRLLWETPLVDEFPGRSWVFLLDGIIQENPGVPSLQVLLMQPADSPYLGPQFVGDGRWQRHGPVFFPFSVHG